MVAVLLPVSFLLSTLFASATLSKLGSAVALGSQQLEVWILKKSSQLGINPAMLYLRYKDKTEEEKILESRSFAIHVAELDPIPGHEELAGNYVLVGNEVEVFKDGLRHLLAREVKNEEPILNELVWSYGADFAKFKRLSAERMQDPVFRWISERRGVVLPALPKT